MAEIELHPGIPFCDVTTLNRVARQQGLCLAMAQAFVHDEICRAVELPAEQVEFELQAYLQEMGITSQTALEEHRSGHGWSDADLLYFASRAERLDRFKRQMFDEEVELRFLDRKQELDAITYSMIRVHDGNLAFELHQRIQEEEASFETLATRYSEGAERESGGRCGPVALDEAHEAVVLKLRTSRIGELLPPFYLVDVWLILRLEDWQGARLDSATRNDLREELFNAWLERRVNSILAGRDVGPLPTHRLESLQFPRQPDR